MRAISTRRQRASVLFIVVLAGLTAWSVTPAAAAPRASSSRASATPLATEGAATFSLFGGSSVAARGRDAARAGHSAQVHAELPASAKGKAGKNFRQSVPVWFHVVSDGASGTSRSTVIQEQMNVLNLAFGGVYGGVNTGFSFRLAGVTRTNNAAWHYAAISGAAAHAMKRGTAPRRSETLNIYATTAEDYLGWAYLPDIVTKPGQAYLDGIVVDWESMPGASTKYAGQYDRGQTATHEVGHWLNLEHTFFGGLQREGRLRRRHAGAEGPDERLSGRPGHMPRGGSRPDPQLHGLLVRHLLLGVHGGSDAAHARRLAPLARVAPDTTDATRAATARFVRAPLPAPYSGDRALASGARSQVNPRRIDSCSTVKARGSFARVPGDLEDDRGDSETDERIGNPEPERHDDRAQNDA